MPTIRYPATPYRDLKREQLVQTAIALEDMRDRSHRTVEKLAAILTAIDQLHVRQHRYTTTDGDFSYDTAIECAEAEDIPLEQVETFDICAHCGGLEMWNSGEDGRPGDYMDAIWPCKTRKAIDAAREAVGWDPRKDIVLLEGADGELTVLHAVDVPCEDCKTSAKGAE